MMIPKSRWQWFGFPGHFIMAARCQFHLCTRVGDVLVSTVGDCRPDGPGGAAEIIGWNRLYETMVFPFVRVDEYGCAVADINSGEMDSAGYNTPIDATAGHYAMCAKWAARQEEDNDA